MADVNHRHLHHSHLLITSLMDMRKRKGWEYDPAIPADRKMYPNLLSPSPPPSTPPSRKIEIRYLLRLTPV